MDSGDYPMMTRLKLFAQWLCAFLLGVILFIGFAAIILAISESACADESSTWLQLGAASYHFDRDQHYNEINAGLGIEHQFNARHSLAAGFYRNSERNTSYYAVYGYTPIELGPVKLGALAGAANGYSAHDGKWFPVILPVATAQIGRAGVNVTVIPPITEKIDGGIAVQFKWRF